MDNTIATSSSRSHSCIMMNSSHIPEEHSPGRGGSTLLCHRCGVELTPGEGNFWIVRIDAVCDPSPPIADPRESLESIAAEYEALLAQMSEMSEQELKDQVHRQLVMHLCTPCFRKWIEQPTGEE